MKTFWDFCARFYDFAEYKKFLEKIGFENCVVTYFKSDMPMAVAVCEAKGL